MSRVTETPTVQWGQFIIHFLLRKPALPGALRPERPNERRRKACAEPVAGNGGRVLPAPAPGDGMTPGGAAWRFK